MHRNGGGRLPSHRLRLRLRGKFLELLSTCTRLYFRDCLQEDMRAELAKAKALHADGTHNILPPYQTVIFLVRHRRGTKCEISSYQHQWKVLLLKSSSVLCRTLAMAFINTKEEFGYSFLVRSIFPMGSDPFVITLDGEKALRNGSLFSEN